MYIMDEMPNDPNWMELVAHLQLLKDLASNCARVYGSTVRWWRHPVVFKIRPNVRRSRSLSRIRNFFESQAPRSRGPSMADKHEPAAATNPSASTGAAASGPKVADAAAKAAKDAPKRNPAFVAMGESFLLDQASHHLS